MSNSTTVFLCLNFEISNLLRSKFFIECKLGVTVLHTTPNYLFACDSQGGVPSAVTERCTRVGVSTLRKLFPKNKSTAMTSVGLKNSQLGARAIRSRRITAARVDDTVPSFDDHAFVCTEVSARIA